jgi:hypothetical protein
MASFAKIGLNNKVIEILSVHNNELLDSNGIEQEVNGIDFLTKLTGWAIWKQTSYNTKGGVHSSNKTPLRKNFAGIGYTYDEDRDAFIPKKPYNSWILNEQTCLWEAPVPMPMTALLDENGQQKIDKDGLLLFNNYIWNETTKNWDLQNI